jgi:tetratricopeptide (TPR) repeat protein
MPYDLFISYSRKDNLTNRVTELKNHIETDYLEFAKEPLNCFFDQEEIKGMDDWQFRLLQGLKDSHLLLVILSPNYLASPYCEWEIVEYLKYEYSRGVAGDGVAQVYFMEIPGIDDEDFRAKAAAWLEKVSRRQRIDLRPWRDEGADSLKRMDVKKRLEELKESLRKRITRMRVISEVPGNLPAPNPRFVGREREMEMLHKATALGRLGVIAAVHGVGGLGKTAIAFQYSYAYANFYPGGRWYLGCANETNLASVIKRLDADLNITLTEDEKKDDLRGAKRILNELYNRAVENAEKANNRSNATTSDKEYSKPAVLLILDNVDHPELIQPPCSDIISGKEWLKIIATTRMGPEELGEDESTHKLLTIDELPFDDGVSLIESYQVGGRFKNSEEKEKAGEIVKLLGGFTLAVEVAALYLYEKKGRVSCAEFIEILKAKGGDWVGENTKKQLSHTKLISATLAPTLDSLTREETLILSYTSLLPPDSIPLTWVKALVVKEYPQMGEEEMAGIDNPWISTINHLLSLRLLQVVDIDSESHAPRLLRMHRLVREFVRESNEVEQDALRDKLAQQVRGRCNDLELIWHLHQWEIPILIEFARSLLEAKAPIVPKFMRALCQWLPWFDRGRHSVALLQDTSKFLEAHPSEEPLDLSVNLSNLGWALDEAGREREAEDAYRRALEIDERQSPLDEHAIAVRCCNLGACLSSQGKIAEAETLLRRAVEICERVLGVEHHGTLSSMNALANLLLKKGDYAGAQPLYERTLEVRERVLGPEHFATLLSVSNLAVLLTSKGDYAGAQLLYERALEAGKRVLGTEHPDTLVSMNNLAGLLQQKGDYGGAQLLYERALEAQERALGPEHPNTMSMIQNLSGLFEKMGRALEATALRSRRLKAIGKRSDSAPLELRTAALDAYQLGDYELARTLLQRVLAAKFELPGTYCHLARIALLMDELATALDHAERAWSYRAEAPPYVIPRILWFRLAARVIVEHEAHGQGELLSIIKTALTAVGAHMEWTMQPVLNHIKPKLTEHQHALLSALVHAMSDKKNMKKLNGFAEWRDAKPEEIE